MKAGYTSSKKRRKERRTQQRKQVRELQQLIPGKPEDMDVSWLRELLTNSVEGFAAEAGWRLALLLLEDEVTRRCGPRYSRPEVREVTRYGRQPGVVMIAGQKQGVLRPRIRGRDRGPEIPLETYALLQRPGTMPASTLAKMVHGVSCRSYEQVVETARAGFGVSKSSVSRGFVRASAAELEKLMSRRLDTTRPILAVWDGSQTLACAVQKVWGDRVLIQRCQVHKKRNVKELRGPDPSRGTRPPLEPRVPRRRLRNVPEATAGDSEMAAWHQPGRRLQLGRGSGGNAHGVEAGPLKSSASKPVEHQRHRVRAGHRSHGDSPSQEVA